METTNEEDFETAILALQQHDFNLEVSHLSFSMPSRTNSMATKQLLLVRQAVGLVPGKLMRKLSGGTSSMSPKGIGSGV